MCWITSLYKRIIHIKNTDQWQLMYFQKKKSQTIGRKPHSFLFSSFLKPKKKCLPICSAAGKRGIVRKPDLLWNISKQAAVLVVAKFNKIFTYYPVIFLWKNMAVLSDPSVLPQPTHTNLSLAHGRDCGEIETGDEGWAEYLLINSWNLI